MSPAGARKRDMGVFFLAALSASRTHARTCVLTRPLRLHHDLYQYDTDVVTWSPQGRIFQVEYAMEAVKQGSVAVGLKNSSFAVIATLKRAPSELSSYQRKIFKIDDHLGIAISGLTADGRILCRYMRNECLNHRYVYESAMPVGRLVRQVGFHRLDGRLIACEAIACTSRTTRERLTKANTHARTYDFCRWPIRRRWGHSGRGSGRTGWV